MKIMEIVRGVKNFLWCRETGGILPAREMADCLEELYADAPKEIQQKAKNKSKKLPKKRKMKSTCTKCKKGECPYDKQNQISSEEGTF